MKSNKKILSILFFIVFIDLVGVGIVIPVLAPLFLESGSLIPAAWGESARTISLGFLIAVYPFMQFIGSPILGKLSDRYGRKPVLQVSLFGTFLGYLLFAIGLKTNLLWLLFFSRGLDGFTGGNIGVANSAIADLSPSAEDKAKNFGLIGAAFGLGFVFGPFIGGVLADPTILSWFNSATPFWFAAILVALNLILLQISFPETLHKKILTKISIWSGFQNIVKASRIKELRVMFIVAFMHAFGFAFFVQFFPVYLVQKFGYSSSQIGFLFAYIGIWIAFSQGVFTRFAARYFSSEQLLRIGLPLLACSIILMLIPSKAAWLFLIQPLIALFEGLVFPNTTALISQLSTADQQGEILGITQSLRALADSFPPLIAGFVVIAGPSIPTLISGCVIGLTAIIFMTGFRSRKLV